MIDWSPLAGQTVREVEAQLPSVRVIFAGWDAAKNAGIELAYYMLAGDGHQAGLWEAGVYGEEWLKENPNGVITHECRSIDPHRAHAFLAHWRRLVSRGDWHLRLLDVVTGQEVGRA